MNQKKINADTIFGFIIAIIAIAFIVESLGFVAASKDGVPGPGYFPIFAASFLLFFAVLLVFDGIKKQNHYFYIEEEKKRNLIQMLLVFADLILFFALWNFIPFVIASIVFELGLCIILKCSLKFSVVFSVTVVGLLYLIFHTAFKVKLNIY